MASYRNPDIDDKLSFHGEILDVYQDWDGLTYIVMLVNNSAEESLSE